MIGWLVALALAVVLALSIVRQRRFLQHWSKLERIIGELAAGREPRSFLFARGGRFNALAISLEQLADAQEHLRRRRSREEMNLRTILTSMGEGVLVVDRQGILRMVNPALMRLFGLGFDPAGQTVMEGLGEPAVDVLVRETLVRWEPQEQQMPLRRDQEERHLAVSAVPMRNAAGEEGVVMIVRDITRLRQLEDMRREFVANVSHELRTPLAIFRGYLENLRDFPEVSPQELSDTVTILERHSRRLNALVEDLLVLARLESRGLTLKLVPLDLAAFFQQLVKDWKIQCERKQVAFELDLPSDLPPLVADELRFGQVFNNLIENALKYTSPQGRIQLRARSAGAEVELSVEDDGAGIPADDVPHIFERFYRADKARSREQGGTGLGLSIVKHIVQVHGGRVEARSTQGEGTVILIHLPVGGPGQTSTV